MRTYKIWDKKEKINGANAEYIIESLKIRETDEVFLVLDKSGNVLAIEIDRIIKSVYNLDKNLSVEEVAEAYIKIKEDEKLQAEKEILTLEEQAEKISILEAENADLLLDSAIKDSKISTLENDLADLTLEIAMMEVR